MMTFEEEVVADLSLAIKAVNQSDMEHRAQIVCLSALYLFGWLADHEQDLLRVAFANILAQLILDV